MTDALIITIVLASIVSITAAALRFDYWQKKKFHMALDYLYNGDTDEYCLPTNSDWGIRLAEHSLRTAVMAAGVIGLAILWEVSGAPKPPDTLLGETWLQWPQHSQSPSPTPSGPCTRPGAPGS